jgi:HD-like signal output (HDOD) protein
VAGSEPHDPPAPAAAPSPSSEAARAGLRRTLEARCRILLDSSSLEVLSTDVPSLVGAILDPREAVIRQPPLAAQRALAVVRNPRSSIADIAALFEQDPSLARDLLKAANSAYYAYDREPVLSITQALQRVGQGAVEGLILAEMVHGLLCRPGSTYAPLLEDVWSHMTRTAERSRRLGWVFEVDPDAAFTVGLLHDLGKLVIIDHLSSLRSRLHREARIPDAFLETLLDRAHEPIGGLAVLGWKLGVEAALAIATHHREPPPEAADRMSELVHVADLVDHAIHRETRLDLDRVWRVGELTADVTAVRAVLEGEEGLQLYPGHARRAA